MVSLAKNVSMIELDMKPQWVGNNLIGLNLRKKYSINVVAIRHGESVSVDIDPHAPLRKDDKLIVIANTEKLAKLK
jgi:trk system potassium uptake protein TrkA